MNGSVQKITIRLRGKEVDLSFLLLEAYMILFVLGTEVFNTVALVLFALVFAATVFLKAYPSFPIHEFTKWMAALVAFSFLSILWADDKSSALGVAETIFKCALLGIVVVIQCDSDEKIIKLMYCYCLGVLVLNLYCIISVGVGNLSVLSQQEIQMGRSTTGLNANYIAGNNTVSILFLFYLAQLPKKKYWYAVLALDLFVLALASSRAAFLEVGVGFFLYLLTIRDAHRKWFRVLLALLITAAALAIAFRLGLLNTILTRFGKTVEPIVQFFSSKAEEGDIRLRLMYIGWQNFLERPLFGYGLGQFPRMASEEVGVAFVAHSAYTESTVSFGIFGLILWQGLYVRLLYGFFKKFKTTVRSNPVGIALFAYYLMRIFMDLFSRGMTLKYSYIYFAFGFAFLQIHKNDQTDPAVIGTGERKSENE